jgi:cytochrome c
MDNRTNTIAGWVLAGCGLALGLSIVGGMVFHGERPEKMGYAIEGVVEDGATGGGEAAAVPIATLLASADAAKGAEVFKKCASCHSVNQGGANGVGPNLYGTVGEAVAQGKGGYPFSDALKGVRGNWDFDKLNAWLTSPRKFAPGTKMSFAGLGDGQDRANVILYLNTQGSNLPLPAAPAAGAAPADGGNAVEGTGAAPGAANAVDAVAKDVRGETGDIANTGTPASGAPSVDPEAARKGARSEK